jgi:hypothetical protein
LPLEPSLEPMLQESPPAFSRRGLRAWAALFISRLPTSQHAPPATTNAKIPFIIVTVFKGPLSGIQTPYRAGLLTFGRPGRGRRSLIIQAKYGTFAAIKFKNRLLLTRKVGAMKKTLTALGAAALTISAVAVPAPAQAQRGVAAGVAAGLLGGAIVGGAIASQHGYYGPGYYAPGYYGGGPAYVVDPGYGESCIWQRQRFWDGYGWRVRNVRVCD